MYREVNLGSVRCIEVVRFSELEVLLYIAILFHDCHDITVLS